MPSGAEGKQARCARHHVTAAQEERPKRLRLVVNQQVLAERNQAVVPVGAWVERAQDMWKEEVQDGAMLSAFHVEEELKKHQKEKEDHLRRFQGEVKHRVNQHARMRKKQQMLKCYDANSLCRRSSPVCVNDDLEDCFLERPRDILAEQQDQILVASRAGKENKFHCSEGRGKRENQYLMYRRLFMSIERDQVKEMRRQKENEKRIAKIKKGKELLSRAEEKRIHNLTILEESYSGERECEVLGELTLEDQQWKVTDEKKPKSKRVR
ncbi:coiled-coil domain-containing protein 15 isoform X3 [Ambystoma mexicanum]|uniref:coiled-coil domain-containing protein 15 isoform X3 n=1 Tax=Ambystoma mexicanum TaxID=8296 RepID=UPI0037E94DCD